MSRATGAVCLVVGCPNLRPCGEPGHERPRSAPWSPERATSAGREQQRRFSAAVRKREGGRCQSCGSSDRVQAHHSVPGVDDPMYGVALCAACHRAVDAQAR